jgi:hypothetical protein
MIKHHERIYPDVHGRTIISKVFLIFDDKENISSPWVFGNCHEDRIQAIFKIC